MKYSRQSGYFQRKEDPLSKNAQAVSKIYLEVLLLTKNSQTKPQIKSVNNNFYDLYYTVTKNRIEKEIAMMDMQN